MATNAKSAQGANQEKKTVLTVSTPETKPTPDKGQQLTLTPEAATPTRAISPMPAQAAPAPQKELSIKQLMERAQKLEAARKKYEETDEKRKSLELFEISHDSNNAQITIVDANGNEFESSNPRCIAEVVKIWKEDFNKSLEKQEKAIRELMTA